jgi:hypothetical protein
MAEVGTLRRREQSGTAAQHTAAGGNGIALHQRCCINPDRHDLATEGFDVNSQGKVAESRRGGGGGGLSAAMTQKRSGGCRVP